MFYQKELDFLMQVYSKAHLNVFVLDENEKDEKAYKEELIDTRSFFRRIFSLLKEKRLYKYTDNFNLSYRFFILPNTDGKKALIIGPFLVEALTEGQTLEIGEDNALSPKRNKFLSEYYSSLVVLHDNSPLLIMLSTFLELIWQTPAITITDFNSEAPQSETPFSKTMLNAEPTTELIKRETIERRYEFENKLIRAVSLGQLHVETQFSTAFSSDLMEKRASDPIQNLKNYCIIMNTLLRKGAEQGGVHPIYLNEISSDYALKIESLTSSQAAPELMQNMYRAYCRLVRKHKIRQYTPVVQKTILTIDADLSNDLTLKTLATHQGVSSGYLSAVFKKETGSTLSEYVCMRRMDYAEYLLNTTNLQIQTIALHCGIMDVQYFSKLFKRYKGKTPSNYKKK